MWSEKQLGIMDKGGNDRMHTFFEKYDLNTEPVDVKYMSKAA
jgi:hypothetical protein